MTEVGTEGAQPDATAPKTGRGRRRGALAMVVVASLLLFPALLSIWANRQVLNTDNWTRTSTQLLQNRLIRDQLATYLVDQVYANVDVQGRSHGRCRRAWTRWPVRRRPASASSPSGPPSARSPARRRRNAGGRPTARHNWPSSSCWRVAARTSPPRAGWSR